MSKLKTLPEVLRAFANQIDKNGAMVQRRLKGYKNCDWENNNICYKPEIIEEISLSMNKYDFRLRPQAPGDTK